MEFIKLGNRNGADTGKWFARLKYIIWGMPTENAEILRFSLKLGMSEQSTDCQKESVSS
jgi:hypothetical protein